MQREWCTVPMIGRTCLGLFWLPISVYLKAVRACAAENKLRICSHVGKVREFMASETVCSTPCATEVVISTTQNLIDLVSRSPQGRIRLRLENFVTGKSGSAYGLSHTQERSIWSSVSSATKEEGTEGMEQRCNHGCSAWSKCSKFDKYTPVA